jgi:hypothetical protein
MMMNTFRCDKCKNYQGFPREEPCCRCRDASPANKNDCYEPTGADKITISRCQGEGSRKSVRIEIEHNNVMVYMGEMSIENYGHLASGKGYVDIERDDRCLVSKWLKKAGE